MFSWMTGGVTQYHYTGRFPSYPPHRFTGHARTLGWDYKRRPSIDIRSPHVVAYTDNHGSSNVIALCGRCRLRHFPGTFCIIVFHCYLYLLFHSPFFCLVLSVSVTVDHAYGSRVSGDHKVVVPSDCNYRQDVVYNLLIYRCVNN